jgi:hypothetical protein
MDSMQASRTAELFLKEIGVANPKKKDYTETKINKPCPKCNEYALVRHIEAFSGNDVPIMPIYYCKKCASKSYYLTSEYLEYLLENNMKLFDEKELKDLKNDKIAFVKELNEHIIRIFASKRILSIK